MEFINKANPLLKHLQFDELKAFRDRMDTAPSSMKGLQMKMSELEATSWMNEFGGGDVGKLYASVRARSAWYRATLEGDKASAADAACMLDFIQRQP